MITVLQIKGEFTCPNCHVPRQPFGVGFNLEAAPLPGVTLSQFCSTPDCHTKLTLTLRLDAERIEKDRTGQ